jgi:catechol 2,3-dioxygenase-like lactoylglutathione lyase family enzyme
VTRFDHVTLTAVDFAASPAFYDAVLGALGLARVAELVDEDVDAEADAAPLEAVGWGTGGAAVLWLVAGQLPTSGLHGQLRTDSRVQVDTFPAEALRTGGREHRAPRRWPLYRRGEFNAIVADPAGNLIEAVGPE